MTKRASVTSQPSTASPERRLRSKPPVRLASPDDIAADTAVAALQARLHAGHAQPPAVEKWPLAARVAFMIGASCLLWFGIVMAVVVLLPG